MQITQNSPQIPNSHNEVQSSNTPVSTADQACDEFVQGNENVRAYVDVVASLASRSAELLERHVALTLRIQTMSDESEKAKATGEREALRETMEVLDQQLLALGRAGIAAIDNVSLSRNEIKKS